MRLHQLFFGTAILFVWLNVIGTNAVADTQSEKQTVETTLSLKQIMADPDWMGRSPVEAQWVADSQSLIFSQKALGHSHFEQSHYHLADNSTSLVSVQQQIWAAGQAANKNIEETQGVFCFEGDVFLIDYQTSEVKQLTADEERQSDAQFIGNNRISYMQSRKIFVMDLMTSLPQQIADFILQEDPELEKDADYLVQSQPRFFEYVAKTKEEKRFQKERQNKLQPEKNKNWYLGESIQIKTFRLSPNAKWLILGTIEKKLDGLSDNMPEFVTEDGYVNNRKVRSLVGTDKPENESFFLIDLDKNQKYPIDTSKLPGINDDPLKELKKNAAKKIGYKYKEQTEARAVYAHSWNDSQGVEWSNNSQNVAMELFSYDNKDRWIVGVEVNDREAKTLHWLSDSAWVNDWTFNQFGWMPDNQTLYYLSEESGYSHLYIKTGKRRARQLTDGHYEVSDLTVAKDGEHIYYTANKKHPGIYETYRVATKSGSIQALTDMGGVNEYSLSPDEKQLVIRHSTTTNMPELFLLSVSEPKTPLQITHTESEQYSKLIWQQPKIIEVPSSHIKRSIYARMYPSQNETKAGENQKKPAVIFVHGAGYLQNSHQGWSGYFREFMFHNLLTQQGYTVLDMDYRASKGYGRDWRTAIYRNMGTPELEDLKDGAQWLIDNADVDPKRIGIYGGSYGGFMTFMALFKEPDLFAAGAALRPVTDWVHYNHGYTSNILNTPQSDPEAYERSSPIEFANGLKKPLLICHGMLDDNVFFKDSVRLVQKLIELEKTEFFETAIYPVEPHGFKEPSSWLDEYTRIYQLFNRHLN